MGNVSTRPACRKHRINISNDDDDGDRYDSLILCFKILASPGLALTTGSEGSSPDPEKSP